jgi:hypothetical protein
VLITESNKHETNNQNIVMVQFLLKGVQSFQVLEKIDGCVIITSLDGSKIF